MSDDRDLGLDALITRKDFLNATLLGVGGMLISNAAPAWAGVPQAAGDSWTGFGGTGDYARSNGNPKPVLDAAHRVRDGLYATLPSNAIDTGEFYDVVIVGGGIAGLAAAYTVAKVVGPIEDMPDHRESSHLRRRRQAERVPCQRRAARRAAGIEPVRRAARRRRWNRQ